MKPRAPALRTEQLLTRPEGFGVASATPAQRAACRILDGWPLGELAQHPDVLALVGGAEALQALPSERGVMPAEVVLLAAIRGGKTIIACAAAIRATQAVDVSRLGPGEVPRVSLVSLKLDTSAVAHRILLETIKASRVLKRFLLEESSDALLVRHPSGRPIEIACVAGAKAGGGLVARWSAGVIFDEAPRMNGASDAVVNLTDARSAVLGRLLRGAQCLMIGSPWAPHGPVYELTQEHWQKPSEHMVILRGTGPMLNPTWWTPERCAKLQEQDSVAHQTDVQGEFADPESGLLNPVAVRTNTRETLELEPEAGGAYTAAIDPAEGAAKGNAWTLVIVQHVEAEASDESDRRYRVALAQEWRGARPEQCWQEIAAICKRYGLREAWTDQYAASANVDLAARYGLTVHVDKSSAASKLEDFTNLATLIHTGRVELSPDRAFRRDILSVRKRVTQQGMTIVLPRQGDGRHCDFAPALCSAVKHAADVFALDGPMVIGIGGRDSANPGRINYHDHGRRGITSLKRALTDS